MKSILLSAVLALSISACGAVQREYAEADEATRQTVGVEWLELKELSYRQLEDGSFEPWTTDDEAGTRKEKLERAQRKFASWGIRTQSVLGKEAE